jgi:hypothetical protein
MATKTAGTLATTSLTAVQFSHDPNALANADFATIALGICKDGLESGGNLIGAVQPGAFTRVGDLWLPTSLFGPLKARNGKDWVCTDGYGNVFLIPQRAMPKTLTGSVTLTSGSNTVTSTTDITTYGWQVGTYITSSHTPAGTVIGSIAPGVKSFTMVAFATAGPGITAAAANATGSATETMTAGTFTHS